MWLHAALRGKFTNAEQTCVAPDYVLATPDVAEALAERIAVAITEFLWRRSEGLA